MNASDRDIDPVFSIITAVHNPGDQLDVLRRSILEQDFLRFEWLVQDALSVDCSVSDLAAVEDPRLRIESRADRGIYDAFNLALDRARGKWILFLGADDRLADRTVLSRLADALSEEGEVAALLCSARWDSGETKHSTLGWRTNVVNTVHHQGVVYDARVFDGYRYPLDVPVIADYELNLLLHRRRAPSAELDLVVALCGNDGVSRSSDEWQLYRGLHRLRRRHMPWILSVGCLAIGWANVARRRVARGRERTRRTATIAAGH
jgi:glycosyltransferase involved in cell wall biosynthesis